MKFYCDSCNTKYAIADEKVRGKVLKVRCKQCENIITVREARTPDAAEGEATTSAGVPQENWYYAVNGVTSGPFDLDVARAKFASGEVGNEAYVWHDTFDAWEPVSDVDTFSEALSEGQAMKPRAKTLGFTGKLEAVKAPLGSNKETAGTVPRPSAKTSPKPASPVVSKEPPASEEAPIEEAEPPTEKAEEPSPKPSPKPSLNDEDTKDVRADKLAALRAKLKEKKTNDAPAVTADSDSGDFDAQPTMVSEPGNNIADALGSLPPAGSSAAATDQAESTPSSDETDHDDAIPAMPTPSVPSTTSTSDIFEIPGPIEDDEVEAEEDAVPFFPSPSAAAAAPAEQSALTGSLLIQLDKIQKQGRGGRLIALAAIIILLVGAAAGGLYLYNQPRMAKESSFAAAQGPGSGEHRELKFNRYSNNDQRKILELGDEEIESMEFEAEAEPDTEKPASRKSASKKPASDAKASATADRKTKAKATREGSTEAKPQPDVKEKSTNEGVALAAASIDSTNEDGTPSAEATRRKAELFRSATSVKREETAIARPEDSLGTGGTANRKLTREQALEGMRRVSRSVQLCRERHMRRGGSFDAQKIFVTVTVSGDGRVTKFKSEPTSLQNTEFGRCMNSHKGRWRFAAFGGDPQPVRRRFIIQ